MNEELESVSIEELQALDDRLRDRSLELDELNALLEAILASVAVGVVVVDPASTIVVWNRRSEALWGLPRAEAVGRNFLGLDIGLPVERLRGALADAIGGNPGQAPIVLEAVDRRGRQLECAVSCSPLVGGDGEVRGAVMLMEERPGPPS